MLVRICSLRCTKRRLRNN